MNPFPEFPDFIDFPSVTNAKKLRDLCYLKRILDEKKQFHGRTRRFIRYMANEILNKSICVIRRYKGFDNKETYKTGIFKISPEDWNRIRDHLEEEGYLFEFQPHVPNKIFVSI